MRKLALAGIICLAFPATSAAFSVSRAHRVAQRFERDTIGSPAPHVGGCHKRGRIIVCSVSFTAQIANGTDPVTFRWTDLVSRDSKLAIWAGDWNIRGLTVQSVRLRQI